MVKVFVVHTKHYYEEPLRNFKKLCPVWIFLQAAENNEIFATGGIGIFTCCMVQART
jgi:hypothetical protein